MGSLEIGLCRSNNPAVRSVVERNNPEPAPKEAGISAVFPSACLVPLRASPIGEAFPIVSLFLKEGFCGHGERLWASVDLCAIRSREGSAEGGAGAHAPPRSVHDIPADGCGPAVTVHWRHCWMLPHP